LGAAKKERILLKKTELILDAAVLISLITSSTYVPYNTYFYKIKKARAKIKQ